MHLPAWTRDEGNGGGLVGNARETRFRSPRERARVKIDLPPVPVPPRCWNSISLVYVALRIPLCAQNELNIFAARTSASKRPEEFQCNDSAACAHARRDLVRELKLIERPSMERSHARARIYTDRYMRTCVRCIAQDYRYDRSERYLSVYGEDSK